MLKVYLFNSSFKKSNLEPETMRSIKAQVCSLAFVRRYVNVFKSMDKHKTGKRNNRTGPVYVAKYSDDVFIGVKGQSRLVIELNKLI